MPTLSPPPDDQIHPRHPNAPHARELVRKLIFRMCFIVLVGLGAAGSPIRPARHAGVRGVKIGAYTRVMAARNSIIIIKEAEARCLVLPTLMRSVCGGAGTCTRNVTPSVSSQISFKML